jgi:hypothetical protein
LKPTGTSQEIKTFQQLVRDALDQFKKGGYVDKVKIHITPESLPSDHQELLVFLCDQIACIDHLVGMSTIHDQMLMWSMKLNLL